MGPVKGRTVFSFQLLLTGRRTGESARSWQACRSVRTYNALLFVFATHTVTHKSEATTSAQPRWSPLDVRQSVLAPTRIFTAVQQALSEDHSALNINSLFFCTRAFSPCALTKVFLRSQTSWQGARLVRRAHSPASRILAEARLNSRRPLWRLAAPHTRPEKEQLSISPRSLPATNYYLLAVF